MKIAIMQPYFFPYLGYFHLINSVDNFVFYDNVNFIKNGWINRNKILVNGKENYLTLELIGASPNKLIKDVQFKKNYKLFKKIEYAYRRAPFYFDVMPVIEKCFNCNTEFIGEMASNSVIEVCEYLNLKKKFFSSTSCISSNESLNRIEKIVEICRYLKSDQYINNYSGQTLYTKEEFQKYNIELMFIKSSFSVYKQFQNDFISGLSIIDIMMFNSPDTIRVYLNKYILL